MRLLGIVLILLSLSPAGARATDGATLPPNLAKKLAERLKAKGDPSLLFSAEAVDLNGDGKMEWLIQQSEEGFCGTPNCPVWVYRQTGEGFESLLDASGGYEDALRALTTSTKGWRDVQTREHVSALRHQVTVFRFNGNRYVRSSRSIETADEKL